MTLKNPTQWMPPSGEGFVINVGTNFLVANNGNFLVTNSLKFLVTTPVYAVGKYATLWSETGV